MTLAFLFPGQGARNVLEGIELARTLGGGALIPEGVDFRALERTEVLQPVLTAVSLTIARAVKAQPTVVLGHSLGEVAACAFAGAFDTPTAVQLAETRGRLMAREAAAHPGGLIALESGEAREGLELAAVNAPDEFVFGGPTAALGSHRRVPVSGAWHTSAMNGAVDEFRAALTKTKARELSIPLLRNLDGSPTRSVDSLVAQLSHTVQFTRVLETLVAQKVDTVVCVGPGLVMRGLLRKNLGTRVKVFTTEDAADLERTNAALSGR
ncbi:MAG: acyltransferase domain-containing protein [Archangium sp.]